MRHEPYTYDIATRDASGTWVITWTASNAFSRDSRSIARSLLERWINDHLDHLPGGRLVVLDGREATIRDTWAHVRVRVYAGTGARSAATPIAIAYLGHPEGEPTGERPMGLFRRWLTAYARQWRHGGYARQGGIG